MRESPLLHFANPDAVVHIFPLDDDHNALALWRAAAEMLTLADDVGDLTAWFDQCECQQPECPTCHPLEQHEFDKQVSVVLQENAEALRRFREGLERGRLQIRVAPPDFDDERFSLGEARTLCRLLALQSVYSRHQGEWKEAISAIEEMLKLGRFVADSALGTQFLVGVAVQNVALSQAADLIQEHPARSMAEKLLASLDLIVGTNEVIGFLRREFCLWSIPIIEQIPDHTPIAELVDKLIESFYVDRPMLVPANDDWTEDGRIAQRNKEIMSVLQDHPHPWDSAGTVRLVSEVASAQIAAMRSAYLDPLSGVLKVSEPQWPDSASTWWPVALSPAVHYEYLGGSAEARAARVELATLMETPPETFTLYNPLTAGELTKWRDQIRQIDNPIGKLFAENLGSINVGCALERLAKRAAPIRRMLSEQIGTDPAG